MLIQCSICKRIRKFGQWIKAPETLITDSNIPIKFILCDDCRGLLRKATEDHYVNGGCERLRKLEKKVTIFDITIAVMVAFWTIFAVIGGVFILQWWVRG